MARKLRDDIVAQLRAEIEAAGSPPVCLATVLVGDDKPSQIYVRSKQKKAAEAGMQSRHVAVDGNVSQAELEDTVAALVADTGVHGILCQLPLPGDLDAEPLLQMIPAGEGCRRPHRGIAGSTRCVASAVTSGAHRSA